MNKPYVVSADIQLLLRQWAVDRGFTLPSAGFVSELRTEFSIFMKGVFPSFEFVPESELTDGITQLVWQGGLVPVSLDRVYLHSPLHLDLARLVDNTGMDRGLGRRAESPPLLRQFRALREAGLKEIALVDDVVFTGALIEKIIQTLLRLGIQVPLVYAGVAMAEGIHRINQSKRTVRYIRRYEEVIDEVCERDFYPGVPFSGRLLVNHENVGVPYLLPFGHPGKWASIPDRWQVSFSGFCLQQTIRLFEEIERCSDRMVGCSELGRMVATLPRDGTRFVEALRAL